MANRIETVILSAARSPFNTGLSKYHIQKIAGQVIQETAKQAGILTDDFNTKVRHAFLGCATQSGTQGVNVGRRAILEAFGPNGRRIFTNTVNSSCDSGLDTVDLGDSAIKSGKENIVIVGGFDANVNGQAPPGSDAVYQTTSPFGYLKNSISTMGLAIMYGKDPTRLGEELFKKTMPPDYNFIQMNVSADYMARLCDIDRERIDWYSADRQAKAIVAAADGWFKKEIVPINMGPYGYINEDEIRENSSLFALKNLKPTLKDGLHHAGSSSRFGIGASSAILANEEEAVKSGQTPLARIIGIHKSGTEAGHGQLLGPIDAVREVLKKTGLTIDDMDIIEVHEAYAAEPLIVQDEFNIPDKKLNIHGGAIALSHPFAASGGRQLAHAVHTLQRQAELCKPGEKKPKYALITICAAQGLAIALIVERWDRKEYLKRIAA